MQQCGLPGLRKQREDLDTAKKTTRESQHVEKKEKQNQLAWAGKLLYIIFMAVQQG